MTIGDYPGGVPGDPRPPRAQAEEWRVAHLTRATDVRVQEAGVDRQTIVLSGSAPDVLATLTFTRPSLGGWNLDGAEVCVPD